MNDYLLHIFCFSISLESGLKEISLFQRELFLPEENFQSTLNVVFYEETHFMCLNCIF